MDIYLIAFLIGVISGLRAMTGLMAVSWAVYFGWMHLEKSWLSFFGSSFAPYIFSALAIGELCTDKLAITPSRKSPPGFITRIITGAVCGAAVGIAADMITAGLVAGAVGAVAGTLGGYEGRIRLAKAFSKDLPAALIEDAVAVGGAFLIVSTLR